jgi:hypothetical protein
MRISGMIVLALLGTANAAPSKLGFVTKIVNGEWSSALASPDGNWVAYWRHDGLIELFDVARRKASRRIMPDGFAGMRLVWSPDSRQLAYVTDAGIAVYDLTTDASRAVTTTRPTGFASYALAIGFDDKGVLFWMKGRELWRDGGRKPITKLPAMDTKSVSIFGPGASHRSVLTCVTSTQINPSSCTEILITELQTGKTRSIFRGTAKGASVAFEPHISPTEDRICYLAHELRCIELATNADTPVAFGVDRWGHMGYPALPFSPSGRAIVFAVRRGERTITYIHDFASGTSRPLADTGHLDRAFLDDNNLLLFENRGSVDEQDTKGALAQLVRIDITTNALTPLVMSHETFTVPVIIPRHPELMFSGREVGPGRDFVRIDLPPPTAAPGAEPPPTVSSNGVATFYWPNGAKRAEGPMQNGKKHGTWTLSYPDRKLWLVGNYLAGQEQGTWSYYYPNGTKGFVLDYHLGAPNGPWTWWSANGTTREVGQYKLGHEDGVWTTFYPSGKKRAEGRHMGGSWAIGTRHWCANGRELTGGGSC